jgi:hypothetical protein
VVLATLLLFNANADVPLPRTASFQIRAVESKPILNAYNALTMAIGESFDQDSDASQFPQSVRQSVLKLLSEVKSGMLALIRNAAGVSEGSFEDVPKILPDIQALRQILTRDRKSDQALVRFRDRIYRILPAINRTDMGTDKKKEVR